MRIASDLRVASSMVVVIAPALMTPTVIVPTMISPVIAIPRAYHNSGTVVARRRRRSVVDRRRNVVRRRSNYNRRYETDADPDVNTSLRSYREPNQQRRAETKVRCLEFHVRPRSGDSKKNQLRRRYPAARRFAAGRS